MMKKLRIREAPELAKVIQQVKDKARNQIRVAELPLLGSLLSQLLVHFTAIWELGEKRDQGGREVGVSLGPSWMVVGRNGAERRKRVPTTPYPHSAGRAVSNYPRRVCLFGCKNPSFQHPWAVTFLSH